MKQAVVAWFALVALQIGAVAHATPIVDIVGLESITIFERTGGDASVEYEFSVNGPELTTLLSDPLGESNNDISGARTEYYDVYYSDADGTFNATGEYLTISGVFEQGFPISGGLN